MKRMIVPALAAVVLAGLSAAALQPAPPPAPKPDVSSNPAPAAPTQAEREAAQAAFLAGSWRGTMNGAVVEETWTNPAGNNVLGLFRWLNADGTIMMSEILAITAEPDGVRLRLTHFDAGLSANGKGDKPLTLKLDKAEPARLEFVAEKDCGDLSKIVYTVQGEKLSIDVHFAAKGDKPRKPLEFRLTRQTLGAPR
ncbi:MAG TPA: DUF6265 family protein [Phycisphaerales bacterium]|nr:DUF6265 family protein [Phycisphaerales bacterium]